MFSKMACEMRGSVLYSTNLQVKAAPQSYAGVKLQASIGMAKLEVS
jgi:hypothetical protein